MKKLLIIAASVALFGVTASAQVINSVELGYSPVTLNSNATIIGLNSSESENLNAISASWSQARAILDSTPLYVQYGAGVQYAWNVEETDLVKTSKDFLTIKVPVNVLFDLAIPSTPVHLMPFAGVNVQGYLLGQQSMTGGKTTTKVDLFEEYEDMNRVVLGWQAGAKVAFQNFFVGVSYEGPITNLLHTTGSNSEIKMNTHQVNISLGISF